MLLDYLSFGVFIYSGLVFELMYYDFRIPTGF